MVGTLKLQPLTKNTHSTPETLLTELKAIAKQGYAIDNEEFMDGMVAIAVPIRDTKERYLGSLAFHGPSQRLTVEIAVQRKAILIYNALKMREVLFT
jgi:DNA-binding IclR family transcriptional regulator